MHQILKYIHKNQQSLYTADWGLERTRYFLNLLNNPHHNFLAVHIAGTSGKTSTSTIIAKLLLASGYSVGLTVSPHLISENERIWVNGFCISDKDFDELMLKLKAFLPIMKKSKYGLPTYFEFLICAAFLYFSEQKVDIAVVEVGLGGLFDSTNVLDAPSKIAVITKIGLDHQKILGDTIFEIAGQKAGIIHLNNKVFSAYQNLQAKKAINNAASLASTKVSYLPKIIPEVISKIAAKKQITGQAKSFIWKDYIFKLAALGDKQIQNAYLSLEAVFYIVQNFSVNLNLNSQNISKINLKKMVCIWQEVLAKIKISGRIEPYLYTLKNQEKGEKLIILDGAHNPEKIENITSVLHQISQNKTVDVLIAIKQDKQADEMIKKLFLTPKVKWGEIFCTQFTLTQDLPHQSIPANQLAEIFKENFKENLHEKSVKIIPKLNPKILQNLINTKPDTILLVIGSLYLVGEVKKMLLNDV